MAVVTTYGADGMTVSYPVNGEEAQGGVVYKVATEDETQGLQSFNIIADVEGTNVLTEGKGVSIYEVTSDGNGVISVKGTDGK